MTNPFPLPPTITASDWRDLPPEQIRPAYDAAVQQMVAQANLAVELGIAMDACDLFPDAATAGEALTQANAWADAVRANS